MDVTTFYYPYNPERLRLKVFNENCKSDDQTMEVGSEADHEEDEYLNYIGVYQNDVANDDLIKEECKEIELKQRNYNYEVINTNVIEDVVNKKKHQCSQSEKN